jgi:hypothetical protein
MFKYIDEEFRKITGEDINLNRPEILMGALI